MNKELSFRTFSELLESVELDLSRLTENGMIEPATLIKVAQRVSYDLGLKIHKPKETILDVYNGKAKLPNDFYSLKAALMCGTYRVTTPPHPHGRVTEDVLTPNITQSTCPCWTIQTTTGAQTTVIYCDETTESVYFEPGTHKICAKSVEAKPSLTLIKGAGCWLKDDEYTCTRPKPGCDDCISSTSNCNNDPDPMRQSLVYSTCNGTVVVTEKTPSTGECREYTIFEKLAIKPGRWVDPQCMHLGTMAPNSAEIKDGYLYTSYSNGKVYIRYLGMLEDEDGNLLVLDHEKVNDFYEYALKLRILENNWISGEDFAQRLALIERRYNEAQIQALSFINTPDFREIRTQWLANRKSHYARYYQTFSTGVFNYSR
jgi:hypothetical protein